MLYTVYILQSQKHQRYYIGHTENMDERFARHNSGKVPITKHGRPWKIIHIEQYPTKSDAQKREFEIKKYKGGILFKKLLGFWKDP